MTISFSPTYPSPGDEVTLSTSPATGGDSFVYALTSVPSGSDLAPAILALEGQDPPVGALDAIRRAVNADTFTPDAAGVYAFSAYELRSRPDGSYAFVGIQTANLNVSETLDLEIATVSLSGAVVLRIGVADVAGVGYVRTAELTDASSEPARLATQATAVVAALTAIVDAAVTTVLGEQLARAADLRAQLQAATHFAAGTWHTAPDADNPVARVAPKSAAELVLAANDCRASLVSHMSSVSLAGTGVHTNDDTANSVLLAPARTIGQATALLSHLRTTYERHRVRGSGASPPVHTNAGGDTTNPLAVAACQLDTIVAAYLDAFASTNPSAPAGEGTGALYAMNNAGLKPSRI